MRDAALRNPMQTGEDFLKLILEPFKQWTPIGRYVSAAFIKVGGQRIHELTVLEQGVMQMRSGRKPGAADVSNDLPDPDRSTSLNFRTDRGQMGVNADQGVVVLDPDAAAQFPIPVGELDLAVADRLYRSAIAGGQVDADVRTEAMQDRMIA